MKRSTALFALVAACSGSQTQTDSGPPTGCPAGCGYGLMCVVDRCVVTACDAGVCPTGLTCAAGFCTDLSCTPACPNGQICLEQVCLIVTTADAGGPVCTTPRTLCDGGNGYCVDLSDDNGNCGVCGLACAAGSTCLDGGCSAPAGTATSSSTSSASTTGTSNSGTSSGGGSTGGTSSGGIVAADAGTCLIGGLVYGYNELNPANFCQQCQPYLSNVSWSSEFGGACGIDAGGCTIAGVLVPANAQWGWRDLPPDGCQLCEPNESTSNWTMAADGTPCGDGECESGTCQCRSPLDCRKNNICDVNNDDANCGGCGIVCQGGQVCVNGACELPAPFSLSGRSDQGGSGLGGWLVLAGGQDDGGPLADSAALNTVQNFWSSLGSLPVARSGLTILFVNDGTYAAAGGTLADGGLTDEVDLIPESFGQDWTESSLPLAYPVTAAASTLGNVETPLLGGTTVNGATNEVQLLASVPDLDAGGFVVGAPALATACTGAVAQFGNSDQACVLCVTDASGQPSPRFFFWDEGNTTGVGPLPNWPRPRLGVSGATDQNSLIYIIGGTLPDGGASDQVDIYDAYQSSWSVGPPLPTPRTHLTCLFDDVTNRIYCFGGYNGQFLTTVDVFMGNVGAWAH